MKIDDREAHVRVRRSEAHLGDRFSVYRNRCQATKRGRRCRIVYIATGTIAEFLDEHYAVMRFDSSADFLEGDLVEKTHP